MKAVKVSQDDNGPLIEFQSDGSQRFTSIKIMNLQSEGEGNGNSYKQWEEIGTWQIHSTDDEENLQGGLDQKNEYSNTSSSFDRFGFVMLS